MDLNKSDNQYETELGVVLWLLQNTDLSIKKINEACSSVHEFKIMLLKSGTCKLEIEPIDPIDNNIMTEEELEHLESDQTEPELVDVLGIKTKKYIPKMLRHYIPGIVVWLHQTYPGLAPKKIAAALGISTKRLSEILKTIGTKPVHPVSVQVMSEKTLNELIK